MQLVGHSKRVDDSKIRDLITPVRDHHISGGSACVARTPQSRPSVAADNATMSMLGIVADLLQNSSDLVRTITRQYEQQVNGCS